MAIQSTLEEFKSQAVFRLQENPARIKNCLDRLTDQEVWHRPNESSNSIANLILHLCGNIRQYAISSLGNQEDKRDRDKEFNQQGGMTKDELLEMFTSTINGACETIRTATEQELLRSRAVQGFEMSGIGIVIHVTEHLSYHTGQIALITKLLRNEDLGFYAGFDLNITNQ